MAFELEKIFPPSAGVDLVFNMNSMAPYSRPSIIYDADYSKKEIVIAQTATPFTKHTTFKELHLTTIIKDPKRKLRLGVVCTGFKLIKRFPLVNQTMVAAVKLKYDLPITEINVRGAFRLSLNSKFVIKGKLLIDNLEYYSPRDFSIRDISLTGMGLVVPKVRGNRPNPLCHLKLNQEVAIGIILVNMNQSQPAGTLPIKATIKRVNPEYSSTHQLVGLKIMALNADRETILNKFIHEAQIDELKRLSGRT